MEVVGAVVSVVIAIVVIGTAIQLTERMWERLRIRRIPQTQNEFLAYLAKRHRVSVPCSPREARYPWALRNALEREIDEERERVKKMRRLLADVELDIAKLELEGIDLDELADA
jgi:hypothetical protein